MDKFKTIILFLLIMSVVVAVPIGSLKAGQVGDNFITKVAQKIAEGFKNDSQKLKWIDKVEKKIEQTEKKIEQQTEKLDNTEKPKKRERIEQKIADLREFLVRLWKLLAQLLGPSEYDIQQIEPGLGNAPDINDSGEVVWIQKQDLHYISPTTKIISSIRGELVSSPYIRNVKINNNGDVIYTTGIGGTVKVLLLGTGIVSPQGAWAVDIGDNGEIFWEKGVNGHWQLFSNMRGQLTFDEIGREAIRVNNYDELAWQQMVGSYHQIFSSMDGQITFDDWWSQAPSINDKGEVVWRTSHATIWSNWYGELPISGIGNPMCVNINNNGDIVISTLDNKVYLATPK